MTTHVAPDVQNLRHEVQQKYTELAESPDLTFHFHHGRPLAQILGYPMEQVDAMPSQAIESFAGVGNPFSLGAIQPGETVLDLGSGAGLRLFHRRASRWSQRPRYRHRYDRSHAG